VHNQKFPERSSIRSHSTRTVAASSAILLLIFVTPVHPDRYVVRVADVTQVAPDQNTTSENLNLDPEFNTPPTTMPGSTSQAPLGSVALPPEKTQTTAGTTADLNPGPVEDDSLCDVEPEELLETLPAPPADPADPFNVRLNDIYGVTQAGTPEMYWAVYAISLREPPTLGVNDRVGNAIVRQVMCSGESWGTAIPTGMNPEAVRASVRAVGGLRVRDAPWGNQIGTFVVGAQVDLVVPPTSGWYRCRYGGETGWVPGIYLQF